YREATSAARKDRVRGLPQPPTPRRAPPAARRTHSPPRPEPTRRACSKRSLSSYATSPRSIPIFPRLGTARPEAVAALEKARHARTACWDLQRESRLSTPPSMRSDSVRRRLYSTL